jgi:hypothetical protein
MPIIRSSTTAVAASGLPLERGGSSAVGRGRAGRESNAGGVEISSHPSTPTLAPTQPHIQWVPALFPWGKAAWALLDVGHQPPFALRLREDKVCNSSPSWAFGAQMGEGELYLYFILVMSE